MPKESFSSSKETSAKKSTPEELMTVGPDGALYSKQALAEKKADLPKWVEAQGKLLLKDALKNARGENKEALDAFLAGSRDRTIISQLKKSLKVSQGLEDRTIDRELSLAIAEGKSQAEQDEIKKKILDRTKHLKKLEDWVVWGSK